jgi:hypothetical protein
MRRVKVVYFQVAGAVLALAAVVAAVGAGTGSGP